MNITDTLAITKKYLKSKQIARLLKKTVIYFYKYSYFIKIPSKNVMILWKLCKMLSLNTNIEVSIFPFLTEQSVFTSTST